MLLRSPYFIENLHQDQPYSSMLMIVPYCDFTCEGCQNKHLAGCEVKDFSVDALVSEYKSNPFYNGVTLGGLEVTLSGDEFINDFVMFARKAGIQNICVYTREDVDNSYIQKLLKELCFVENLFLKTGRYKHDLKPYKVDLGAWGIELGSSNQTFIRYN